MNNNKQNIVAIILARGESKGIPRKNIRLLSGKPLIAYTIEAAKRCSLIDRVIVSTDNDEIVKVAKEYGAETPFRRPAELATDTALAEPCLKQVVEWLEKNENYKTDMVVYLQITDIFRRKGIIEEAVRKLIENENLDSVFAADTTHKNFWREKNKEFTRLASDIPYGLPRQKREPLYREDTGLVCATRANFIKQGRRIGDKIDVVINEVDFSFIDINNETDLWLAEKCIERLKKENRIGLYEL
ncbi:MAG: acylneuraminate cytidylyltransferase family protein [Nanoarchaeota archaeon]|nr:acylneuraminate cytidylyltransferase family protein [Nanoarchaeota archaeon]